MAITIPGIRTRLGAAVAGWAACGWADGAFAQALQNAPPGAPRSAFEAFSNFPAATAAVVVGAILLGGLIGRFAFGRASPEGGALEPDFELEPLRPRPSRPSRPQSGAAVRSVRGGQGEFRRPAEAEDGGIFRQMPPDDRFEGGSPPPRRPDPAQERELAEARRLFDYFEESFDLSDRSADGVVAYLERVSSAIERLKQRNDSAKAALERALDQASQAGRTNGEEGASAPLKLAMEGVRTARAAVQTLRSRSDEAFLALAAETDLEETLRRLAGLHGAHADGSLVDPELIEEPWPHALLRADMLVSAYMPADGVWGELREGLDGAAAGLRGALRESGVVVGYVRPLAPYRSVDGEVWSEGFGPLGEVSHVRTARSRIIASTELVIDCETFGYVDRGRGVVARARLIVDPPAS